MQGEVEAVQVKAIYQDKILAKTSEVLESQSKKHRDFMNVIKATNDFAAASYLRWHGEDKGADEFEDRNVHDFFYA